MMYIEIRKTAFVNKGAELMLRAIISKMRESLPEAKLVMEPNLKIAPYINRAELGLYQKVWFQHYNVQWGYFGRIIPKKLRDLYGLVLDSEIDVILDASGFSYSDQWGAESCCVAAEAAKRWKKQKKKLILMPQAFGPFTTNKIRDSFKALIDNADLVFARDRVSLGYVEKLVGKRSHVKIAPDFTNLVDGEFPNDFDEKSNRFCVIPNYRMIDKTSKVHSCSYISFLVECIRYLHSKGEKPFILIHEDANDLPIGKEVAKSVGKNTNIVVEENPLRIKGIIGLSKGVVSSRFHGLVSALSQGVPALATSWTHKYEMLLEDYDFKEGVLLVNSSIQEIAKKLDRIIDDATNRELRIKIKNASRVQKMASIETWNVIFDLIKLK